MFTARLVAGVLISCFSAGCSYIFVDAPPPQARRSARLECTTSRLAPGFDVLFAGLQGVRTGAAIGASDSTYENAPLNRGADVGIGIALLALHASSAVWGFSKTATCRDLKADPDMAATTSPGVRGPWPAPVAMPMPVPSLPR